MSAADVFPVSSGQERMWFLSRFEPDLAVYNVCLWMPIPASTDPDLVERALAALVHRHEPLRTTFDFSGGQVVQVVHASAPVAVTRTDLGALPEPERDAEFERLAFDVAALPFPLETAPLWRARFVRMSDDDLRLIWICDHTIFDGASSAIFVDELYEAMAALAEGRAPDLPELRIQYADYAAWQRNRLTDEFLADELAHWRERLEGLPADLGLPTDRPRPPVRTYGGGLHRFELSPELTEQVDRLAKSVGVTPFMALLAAFKAVLARWAGQPDITVGCPMAGRVLPELEPLIGMFVNAVLVRTDLSGDPTFRDAAQRVRGTLLDAIDHQEMPFERLVEALQPQRDLSRPPLFQVAFNLVPSDTRGQIANGTTKVDLSLDLNVRDGRMHGRLEYATDLFDAATIERLADWFQTFLAAAVRDPDQLVSRIPLMDDAERERVLEASRGPELPLDTGTVLTDLFVGAASDEATAVIAPDGTTLTFGELHGRANRLAHWLRSQRVGPETPVAVCAERSPELVIAVLAVLKAGGVYTPLDPDHPWQRLSALVADSRASLVLTQSHLRDRLRNLPARLVALDEDDPWRDLPTDEPSRVTNPGDAAYLLYTSGTTGKPKGVVTTHEAIVNRLEWMRRSHPPGAVVLHKTPISFDVSVWELCLPPITGAALALARPGGHREPSHLRDLIKERQVTTAHFVPSMLESFLAADGVEECRSLRQVICSGEELPRDLAARFLDRLPDAELHNLYGPTEAAVDVSAWRCERGEDGPVPIGRPVPNTALYVLDEWMAPVPVGVPGELHIGGVQLARGYHRRPERTAASFVPDPFGRQGARLYKTGDLARQRPHGAIEFLGRIDTQVKVHGVRVELGEIEAALTAHSQVERAAAVLREDAPGGPGLVAYVVWSGDPAKITAWLRDHLSRRLPPSVIPQAFVPVDALPTSSSGKLDRAALPSPAGDGRQTLATEYRAPGTPMEEALCGIWRDLLGRDRVGVLDDFFGLGGHSLLVVELADRIRTSFGVDIPLRRCFEITTVERYALEIQERRPEPEPKPAIPRRPDGDGPAPLSSGQERLWFLQEFDPDDPSYNLFVSQRMRGRLVVPALRHAIEEIVRRHDPLRARFPEDEGRPVQEFDPDATVNVELVDLSDLPDDERERRAADLAARCRDTPFTLRTGPVLRAVLLRLAERDHVLCVAFHHIVSDGWSLKVFLSELGTLYGAALDGRQARLPELPVRYADYTAWDRARPEGDDFAEQLDYWTRRLDGARPLELPLDHPRPPIRSSAGDQVAVELSAALMERLEEVGRAHKATPFMTLLAAFQVLLGRYSGQDDLCVGSVVAGRDHAELAPLIGFFPNTVVLRADLTGDPGFGAFLDRVRGGVLDAFAHQDVRFEQVVAALDVERDPSRTPLFQAMFAMQDAAAGTLTLPGLDCELFDPGVRRGMFELTLDIVPRPSGTWALLTYGTDLYDRRTAERLLGSYHRLLELVAEDGDLPLSAIGRELGGPSIQGPPEATWDAGTTLPELITAQARRDPEAVAIVQGGKGISRGELDTRVERLAAALRDRGIGVGSVVAVGLRRTPDLIVALLAVHRAGAAYLPLDLRDPLARTEHMLRDGGASLLVTDSSVDAGDVPTLSPDAGSANGGSWPVPTARDLAYVLYTSGSTGRPKGVEVEHGALVSLLGAMREVLDAGPDDRWLAMTSLSFDISALELFLPLACGGTVVLAADEQLGDGAALAGLIREAGITHVQATPSGWRMLLDGGFTGSGITALTGGEAITPGLASELRARTARLVNVYGPTETTIWSTYWEVPEKAGEVSIGGPIAGTTLQLLDERLDPVPPGAVGELCIGGAGVARGYRDRPATTAERFVPDLSGARLYRTGDLARVRPDGLLEFLGRRDAQVKLRGHRVEPGEIEAVLLAHPGVGTAAVTVHETAPGDQRLAAYVVPKHGGTSPTAAELREHAARTLPAYMVPGAIVELDELPLTPNGKLDRARLPRPGERPAEHRQLPPESAAEELVADIWREVLGVDEAGALDDFFHLGGHSLLATKVTARLGATLELDVPVRTVFAHRTLRDLAAAVERLLSEEIDQLTDEEAAARLEDS